MSKLASAIPANPTDDQDQSRSARWTTALLLLLGFGFTASALIDASEPPLRTHRTAPATFSAASPGAVMGESDDVAAAVRQWVWETPAAERKPAGRYDFEELWLSN